MITQIIKSDCGCQFEISPTGQVFHWCPLHKTAPKMYEALKIALGFLVALVDTKASNQIVDIIRPIVAKAEGKE